jgi:hypothetical protein
MVAAAVTGDQHQTVDCPDRPVRRVEGATRGRSWGTRHARAAGLLALAWLAGCATTPPPDDVTTKITQYYAEHASEEGGRCAEPEIASVTKRKVLARSGEVTHLRVRYSYFDASAPGATDWTRVLQAPRACTGVAERDFTLVSTDLGYKVMQMSGPVREQP